MSTNKSLMKTYLNPDIKAKLNYLADNDNRSGSNLLEYLAINYIKDFEDKHGELIVEEDGTVHPKIKLTNDNSKVKSSALKIG